MKLSIIIPIFNSLKYIDECIGSLREIYNKNEVEIILIDDGSYDGTEKKCDYYAKKYKNIVVVHKENEGVSLARNDGIKISNGEYIMFVDSDDILQENWNTALNEIKDDDIYYFSNYLKDNNDIITIAKTILGYGYKGINFSGPCSKMYKRKLLIDNNINFDKEIINGEDIIFNLEALSYAKNVKVIKNSFYLYREYIGSSTKKFNERIFNSDLMFHNKLNKILELLNFEVEERSKIENFCIRNAIIMLIHQISYSENFANAKKYYCFLDKEPYKSHAKDTNKIRILFYLHRLKMDYLIYIIFKRKNIDLYNKKEQLILI